MQPISSPASTGGAGTAFEQHVNAYWLAQLLVAAIPPIMLDCAVTEVHFQTEHLGWHTDDFLVVAQDGSGTNHKLIGQVKRTFTVSSTDNDCKKAIQDFWQDFNNPQLFSPARDRLLLVTLRGTNTLLQHFAGLMDCARSARDATEFDQRLNTPGLINDKSIKYCDAIREILTALEGRDISVIDVWPFIRVLHVLSLDLNSSTAQTEVMIKNLLVYTSSEVDRFRTAEDTWNALLREVTIGMPEARSYQRTDLPDTLRQRHSPVGGHEQRILSALSNHSKPILDGIITTIGPELHLERGYLVQQIIEQLESNQIVVVSGTAGSGKSGVTKDIINVLSNDYYTFTFRAEEFAHPHLNETLQSAIIPADAATLSAILSGQDRKILLVESVERLLEKPTREAFSDLLSLVAKDRSWQLILTCRDYSTELVRFSFLKPSSLGHVVIDVPSLSDTELDQAKVVYPALERPLSSSSLRSILRNPYFLDKALTIDWTTESSLPESEWEFRTLFWRDIVRFDNYINDGLPSRRERVFVEIALRRARSLSMYARCNDLDLIAVDKLHGDSLIVFSPESRSLASLAHDVLEDWAILHWIDDQYAILENSLRELSSSIGTHPAIRRTYRKWVTELLERNPEVTDNIFQAVVHEAELPAQFRDDTLVSLLHSAYSPELLERHSNELFANDKALLKLVIHLLHVACVTKPDWLNLSVDFSWVFKTPDGPAWACVLRLIQNHLELFTEDDGLLLLGFIEDWGQGVSWQTPYPDGFESVGVIAYWLLQHFDDFGFSESRSKTLHVIAKIPNANSANFAALLRGTFTEDKRDRTSRDFRQIIFNSPEGMPAARDLPQEFVETAKAYMLCTEADLHDEWAYTSSIGLEINFGLKQYVDHEFFPASAYRGAYLQFLRHHPSEGLGFIIDVFNHSIDWYVHPRIQRDRLEPAYEMTLTFADESTKRQWWNGRLWNLYRGTSVGPYVLMSLLMALERWLLELAEISRSNLDPILLSIIRRTDSASLTTVVASVATAFPNLSSETLLVLLSSPECILLDKTRLVHEHHLPSHLLAGFPSLAKDKYYEAERTDADSLPHRGDDLETAIFKLQFGPFAPRVHEIIDQHRSQLPTIEQQNDEDRIWRLALNRMDLRCYTATQESTAPPVSPSNSSSVNSDQAYIRLELGEPEPDLRDMATQSRARLHETNSRLNLLMWGLKVFRQEEPTSYDPALWRQKLEQAQSAGTEEDVDDEQFGAGRKGFVASICLRDHWDDMSEDERNWCIDIVCNEVERKASLWTRDERLHRNPMSSDIACAYVLPLLIGESLDDARSERVHQGLALILTHATHEVRLYGGFGIGTYLWSIDKDLALRCVNTLASQATLVDAAINNQRRRSEYPNLNSIEATVAVQMRQQFLSDRRFADDAYQTMDISTWLGAKVNAQILAIFIQAPTEPTAIAAFMRLAQTIVSWWDKDNHRRQQTREERGYETEATLNDFLVRFLMRTEAANAIQLIEPLVQAIDSYPKEVHSLVNDLVYAEDRYPNTAQFWLIWSRFAEGVRQATWISHIDNERIGTNEMISAIFLDVSWKDGIQHWRSLEGHVEAIHTLLEELPPTSIVLDAYLRFLSDIGGQSLPAAFIRIANRLQQGNPQQMMRKSNTIFMLETLLQRYVYSRPLELKSQRERRLAILSLLDLLVDLGSSAAYRMRDDFVTPISTG